MGTGRDVQASGTGDVLHTTTFTAQMVFINESHAVEPRP